MSGPRRVAGNTVFTAASQIAVMGIGGVLSILVLLLFGKSARTDGFFAAYGIYTILVTLSQSFRVTVIARLMDGDSVHGNLDRYLGATLALAALGAIPLVALGGPLAALLTGGLGGGAQDTAQLALALLWVGVSAQLVAAQMAAGLGAQDRFLAPAVAYVAGGLASVAVLLALEGRLGIDAVAVAVGAGGLVTAGVMAAGLSAAGWRPQLPAVAAGLTSRGALEPLLAGALGSMVAPVSYVVSLAFAARLGAGSVTLYSYAFFATALVMAATAGALGIVLVGQLARTWDGTPAALEPHLLAMSRAGWMLVLPLFGVVALVGADAVDLVLGGSLDRGDPATLTTTYLWLSGVVIAYTALVVPLLAAFARALYWRAAAIGLAAVAMHVLFSLAALQTDRLQGIAAAASASTVVWLLLVLRMVYGRAWAAAAWLLLRELLLLAGLTAIAFVPAGAAASALGGTGWHMAAALTGVALFTALLRGAAPDHWSLVRRMALR